MRYIRTTRAFFFTALILILVATMAVSGAAGPSAMPDPTVPGMFGVKTLTYGSGTDKHRPEYGGKVEIRTLCVNAVPLMGEWTGKEGKARYKYWGFNSGKLPLNGRVWYPDGDGPFPVVLIVHGNHSMREYSDPGYAYLGEMLASQGYITVSVDENFINGDRKAGDFHGRENIVRGWLLLKHLELWQQWNEEPGNPFAGKADMSNIALIGHSRGGEAVALAAAINRLPRHPDNANVQFGFDFAIRAVVAIAPIDGQYRPSSKPVWLEDVNYLVLQGSHDSDVHFFAGSRQFQRVRYSGNEYGFKASLYIYRANHGQFNTVWGRKDIGIPFLNTKPLLPGDEQRQIAKVYIGAFLDAAIKRNLDWLPLFRDPRAAGVWLPQTQYIWQFEDSSYRLLTNYEEDMDPTTMTIPGGFINGVNLTTWTEGGLRYRNGIPQENTAAFIGWNSREASYTMDLPAGLMEQWQVNSRSILVFSLADARLQAGVTLETLDFSVKLVMADGTQVSQPLSRFNTIPRPFEAKFTLLPSFERSIYRWPSEIVLQRYELALAAFFPDGVAVDTSAITSIQLVFNCSPHGLIVVDEVGFRVR